MGRVQKKEGTIIPVYNCIAHVRGKSRCNLLSVAIKLGRLGLCEFISWKIMLQICEDLLNMWLCCGEGQSSYELG